jgi:DNA repair protein RadC
VAAEPAEPVAVGARRTPRQAGSVEALSDDLEVDRRPLIKSIPETERPRERLVGSGAGALSDAELVALLLRTGHAGQSTLQMAAKLLRQVGGLSGLFEASAVSLRRRGLGEAKAATVLAAIEIARRVARAQVPARRPLTRPKEVAHYLAMRYQVGYQEVMGAIFIDSRQRWLADRAFFRGTLHRASVEPRPMLQEALLCNASGMLLFHTHPSGDPTPSVEDVAFTRRMAAAAAVVGVELVDHLVLGTGGRWVSLRAQAAW